VRRANNKQINPLAPAAGRRRRFLFRDFRIGPTLAPVRSAAPRGSGVIANDVADSFFGNSCPTSLELPSGD
jgi:hypothetical protein